MRRGCGQPKLCHQDTVFAAAPFLTSGESSFWMLGCQHFGESFACILFPRNSCVKFLSPNLGNPAESRHLSQMGGKRRSGLLGPLLML